MFPEALKTWKVLPAAKGAPLTLTKLSVPPKAMPTGGLHGVTDAGTVELERGRAVERDGAGGGDCAVTFVPVVMPREVLVPAGATVAPAETVRAPVTSADAAEGLSAGER